MTTAPKTMAGQSAVQLHVTLRGAPENARQSMPIAMLQGGNLPDAVVLVASRPGSAEPLWWPKCLCCLDLLAPCHSPTP